MLCLRCASRRALFVLLQFRLRLQHSDDDTIFKEKRILCEDAQKSSKAFFRQHYVNYYLNTPIVLLYNRALRSQTVLHRFRILTRLPLSPYSLARTLEFLLCTRQKVTACILFIGSYSLDLEPCVDWIYLRYGLPLVLLYLFWVESCYCQDSGHRDWCLFLPLVRILLWDEDCTPDTVSSWDPTLESFFGWWCLCTGLWCFRVWCLSVASLEAFLRSQLSSEARLRMTVLWMLSKRAQHCSLPRFWRLIFFFNI